MRRSAGRILGAVFLLAALAGLVAAVAGAWRPGLLTLGGVLVAIAATRVCRPRWELGSLVLRSAWLDGSVLLTAGVVLLIAALTLP